MNCPYCLHPVSLGQVRAPRYTCCKSGTAGVCDSSMDKTVQSKVIVGLFLWIRTGAPLWVCDPAQSWHSWGSLVLRQSYACRTTNEWFIHFLVFQLAAGFQLIHTLWSSLTSSSQNLAEPVLKKKQTKRTKNPKPKQNQTTITKKLEPNPWWMKLCFDWVMYIAHRGYSNPLYSRFIGNRMMYLVNTSCRRWEFWK